MRIYSKLKHSRLDPFSEQLLKMDEEKKTLEQMVKWLKRRGVSIEANSVSRFLWKSRCLRLEEQLFANIVNGSHLGQAAEKTFKKNPAPGLETAVKFLRVLVMQLMTKGAADRDLLKMAGRMMNTAVYFAKEKTKAHLEQRKLGLQERRVKLLEKKAAQADATDKVLTEPMLSPEERERRIKEIYGR
jgi:hypothetical protein